MHQNRGKRQPAGVRMTPCKTRLGQFIRNCRLLLHWKQDWLAREARVSKSFIGGLERGTNQRVRGRRLERLAKALRCDSEKLQTRMPVKHLLEPRTEVGKLIRSRREALGLTLERFAEKIEITSEAARRLEIRTNPHIHSDSVMPLAKALNLDPAAITPFAVSLEKPTKSRLGKLVRERRKELSMSGPKLAKKLGVSRELVSQIELGKCALSENDARIGQLAEVLKLTVGELKALRPARRLKLTPTTDPLGGFLRAKRLKLRLTQREIGKRAKVVPATISHIELGGFRPSCSLLSRISKALDGCQIPSKLIPLRNERAATK